MGQINLTISIVMIALFTIAIIGFAINFAADNNSPIDISDDASLVSLYTDTRTNASQFALEANSTYKSILETTIAPGSGSAQSIAPFAITPTTLVSFIKNIFTVGYVKIFGTNSGFNIFFTTIIAVLVLIAILFLYKTLRGFPD